MTDGFNFGLSVVHPAIRNVQPATRPDQNPVVGRLLPKVASQGAFFVTCFLSFLHHRD